MRFEHKCFHSSGELRKISAQISSLSRLQARYLSYGDLWCILLLTALRGAILTRPLKQFMPNIYI